ncbi:MAG: hypothetical protein K2Y32_23425 [Candidatus Obscuribacterales bacterium]|nr:hypothetical protein [Candidatus Obscuribacterales bacterium]
MKILTWLSMIPIVLAYNSTQVEKDDLTDRPTIQYDEIVGMGQVSAHTYLARAQAAFRNQSYGKALTLARKTLSLDEDEIEAHLIIAQVLEKKLSKQTDKDPKMMGECVRHWLVVLRAGTGEEAGTNYKGIGGIFDHLYKDDEHYITARQHLKNLVGRAPKAWESNARYMKNVLGVEAVTEASGRIISKAKKTED